MWRPPVSAGKWRFEIYSEGARQIAMLPLEAPPEDPPRDQQEVVGGSLLAGALVDNLSPALADELGIDVTLQGIVILDIRRNSPAHRAGFEVYDILHQINDVRLARIADLEMALQRHGRSDWELHLRRGEEVRRIWLER